MPVKAHEIGRIKPLARLPRASLLLVEEEMEDLLYYSAVLQHLGYEVRSCATYAEAADRLKKEVFDLLIVGQGGPNCDGQSVLTRVAELDRPMPVVVLTAYPDKSSFLDVMRSGTLNFVKKPLAPSELAELIATHLCQCFPRCRLV